MGSSFPDKPRLGAPAALRRRVACGLLAAVALAPLQARAQQTADGSARTQIAILEPGSIANVADMDFGQIVQPSNAGTVVIAPGLSATCTTTGSLVRTGVCRAAEFSIYGLNNLNARLRNLTPTVTLNGPSGATMTVTDFTTADLNMTPVSGANGWNLGRYSIDSANRLATMWLGGTLHVGAAQMPGVYNGTMVIEIEFN